MLSESCAMNYCQDGVQFYNAEEERLFINGHYELQPNYVNGRPYFKMGDYGLWWDGSGWWWFGINEDKGQSYGFAFYDKDVFCPHQFGNWKYAENELVIRCIPWYENYCTPNKTCGLNEGDCDSHDDCQGGLFCGSDNCPTSLGFDPDTDCCTMGMYYVNAL